MKILVVDVGGSHVKCVATDHQRPVEFESGPKLTPDRMVRNVLKITKGWRFGRRLLLDTASVSVLGYDHDLSEPVIHAWNGRGT